MSTMTIRLPYSLVGHSGYLLEELPRWRHSAVMRHAPFVDDVRIVTPVPDVPESVERLPDGKTSIVVRTLADGAGDAWVMGPRTRALFKTATGVARAVIVELGPGWAGPLLGVTASELVDRHVSLDELWGRAGAELRDDLVALHDPSHVVARLAGVFAQRLERSHDTSSRLAREAARLFDGIDRVDDVAARLGITARHLRRVFVESVGIGPKDYLRCIRLQRAVRSVRHAGTVGWARVATDAGYYDQPHLISEFRDLVGVTPSAYSKRMFAANDCGHARTYATPTRRQDARAAL
jgi:AraC-like DNA-binding protein